MDEPPTILLRWCKDRSGIRLKRDYLISWKEKRSTPITDIEAAYNELVSDFLNNDISNTSESVIPDNFGQLPVDTFPPGHLRHGGGVVLQIQDTNDISNSTFSLLNNLKNLTPVRQTYIERNEDDEVNFPRGVLRWTLTDGFRQVQAMEMETIPELDLKTPFGAKLLIQSCQVKRGMLLLTKNTVKVLRGDVPELYGGNMITELESRFKMKLGIVTEPSTPIPSDTNITQAPPPPPPDNDDFDDDIDEFDNMDFAAAAMDIDSIETSHQRNSNNTTPSTLIINTADHNNDSDDDFMMTQPLPPKPRAPKPTPSLSLSKKKPNSSSSNSNQSTPPPKKRMREDTTVDDSITLVETNEPTQDIMEGLDWVDPSVWDALDNTDKDGITMDERGKAHITFEKLQQTLKAMATNSCVGDIPDTVVVRARCIKISKLKLSNTNGFYLLTHLGNPEVKSETPVKVVFYNNLIVELLRIKLKDAQELQRREGTKAVAIQMFKPFEKRMKACLADYEVDLTLTEKDSDKDGLEDGPLMPKVISYTPVP